MKVEQLIREKISSLSVGQKKVAEYILQHLDSFSYSTLAKLSKEISVSETTIIRLAYSLGFESFSEMQRTVQNDILSVPAATLDDTLNKENFYQHIIAKELRSMENWASHLNQDDMEQIVTHLINAKKRLIVGARSSYSAALWIGTLLNQLLGNTKVVHEFYEPNFEYLSEASEDTVVLVLSFARYTKWSLKYAQIAKKRGAKILAITDSISSPAWALADHAVITEINLNEMGFNSFSCLYCLFDSIIAKIRKTKCKSISAQLHDLEELYSDFDLFFE
ncbi:MurR/RpiR family transcriptional regulator [Ruminococcus sp. OM08-7]|nr:MurR/RpiR family transcriptional regulator [Ruminococcus sp. OM08-7]